MKRKLLTILLSLILLLTFATPAFAQGPGGAQVILGDNFVLDDGQTLDRDLVMFGGNVTIDESSTIKGDLIVFGGNADIDGVVKGDIGMIGGNVNLGETAVVKGDIGILGGNYNIDDGAIVKGKVENINQFDFDYDDYNYDYDEDNDDLIPPIPAVPPIRPHIPSVPDHSFDDYGPFSWLAKVIGHIFWTISLIIILSLISWLVASFMPGQMITVRNTVIEAAPTSFGVGLMTAIIVAVSFLLCLTICLIFVPPIVLGVAFIAGLFGWIVIGQIVGERLLGFNGRPQPGFIFSCIVGVTVLTLVTNMPVIGDIPCIGFLFSLIGLLVFIIAGLTGLGAVVLTRFGTRPYPPLPYSTPRGPIPSAPRVDPFEAGFDSDLGVNAASEAELKAKIKAALAEADEAGLDKEAPDSPPAGKSGKKKSTDKDTAVDDKPETETPDPDTPDDEQPDKEPGKKPKTET